MSISQKAFYSESGFASPGVIVDTQGNINIVGEFRVNGVAVIETTDTLKSTILYSSLTTLGTLSALSVNGSVDIASPTTGNINNINIGTSTPASGFFTTLEADAVLFDSANIPSFTSANASVSNLVAANLLANGTLTLNPTAVGAMNNVVIGAAIPASGNFTTVTITTPPTLQNHTTTKQYVDTRIAALAIALGS